MIPGVDSQYAKLYLVTVDNGEEYADYQEISKLVVAESDEHATIKAVKFLLDNFSLDTASGIVPGYDIEEIKEVEGYKVTLIKNTNLKEND